MNLQQFAALAVGDRVKNNLSNSVGEVATVDSSGVRIRWLGSGLQKPHADAPTWHYSVHSTAWFHWSPHTSEVSLDLNEAISDELKNPPASTS